MGTVSVTQALNQEFPEARLARHDAESMSGGGSKLEPDADIYVGTRLLLHDTSENPENMTDWGCVIALDTDGLLSHPGFRVMEDAWRTVCVMRDIAASSGAPLLLQTLDPENPKIRRLLDDSERFMEDEREARKKASYPPVGNLITITVKDGEEPAAERAAVQLSEAAREVLKDAAVSVTGALKPKQPFRDGKWRRVVAIKTSADIPESVIAFLNSLSEEYIIDRNPETI
jgi:primosomal protein N' (replication factor Y)